MLAALTFSNHVRLSSVNLMYVCPCVVVYMCREENQLDATESFIAIIICSICFGLLYAHHQELETILVFIKAYGV